MQHSRQNPSFSKTTFASKHFSSLTKLIRNGMARKNASNTFLWGKAGPITVYSAVRLGNGTLRTWWWLLMVWQISFPSRKEAFCAWQWTAVFHKAERKQHLSKFNLPYFQTGLCEETSFAFISCKTFNYILSGKKPFYVQRHVCYFFCKVYFTCLLTWLKWKILA